MGMSNFPHSEPKGRTVRGGWRQESGFTLLEVLAALMVITIGMIVLLQTDALNTSRALHAMRLLGAADLAREKMEGIFSGGMTDIPEDDTSEGEGPYTWSGTSAETQFPGISEVHVTVRWMEGSREESYSVVAYLPE